MNHKDSRGAWQMPAPHVPSTRHPAAHQARRQRHLLGVRGALRRGGARGKAEGGIAMRFCNILPEHWHFTFNLPGKVAVICTKRTCTHRPTLLRPGIPRGGRRWLPENDGAALALDRAGRGPTAGVGCLTRR